MSVTTDLDHNLNPHLQTSKQESTGLDGLRALKKPVQSTHVSLASGTKRDARTRSRTVLIQAELYRCSIGGHTPELKRRDGHRWSLGHPPFDFR